MQKKLSLISILTPLYCCYEQKQKAIKMLDWKINKAFVEKEEKNSLIHCKKHALFNSTREKKWQNDWNDKRDIN